MLYVLTEEHIRCSKPKYMLKAQRANAFCCLPDAGLDSCILIDIFSVRTAPGCGLLFKWIRSWEMDAMRGRVAYKNRMNVPFDEMTPPMKFHSS